jgi:hypothetical protein
MHTQPCTAGVVSRVLGFSARIAILSVIGVATSFAADPPMVQIGPPSTMPPAIQVGAAPRPFPITVANDLPGDLPTVTSFTLNGVACTAATCGSFSAVTGTSGSGSYSMTYTPPPSLTLAVAPTVTVAPSLSGPSFPGTASFVVYPAGIVVQATNIAGGLNIVQAGSPVRTITFTTYNDIGNAGVTVTLTGGGYACQDLSPNSCGTLGAPQVSTSGTTTTTIVTYTPPKSKPDQPYDRVRIQATSVADPTKLANINFLVSFVPGPGPIGYGQQFTTALTGGAAVTVAANFGDPTATKSADWTLTANGAPCAPACGALGTPTVTTNGNAVTSTVTYTPPASVPAGDGQDAPTITTRLTANPAVRDIFSFRIRDGACGTGNNSALNGQYAFLLKGASATGGYEARVGSFTADGSGAITSGFVDINRSTGVLTSSALTGSYSVGPDNRGCLTLTNSAGGTATFRIALGTMSGGTATQGAITAFVDTTGQGSRLTGVLKRQDLTNLSPSTFSGSYAFGYEGMDSSGYRVALAGIATADGAGAITNIAFDVNDNGAVQTLTGLSGSYSLAPNAPGGRGTGQTVIGGGLAVNYALYVVSPSDLFIVATDPTDAIRPIYAGELKRQTGPFSTSMLASGSGYVFYTSAIDSGHGGRVTILGQAQFTSNTGVATGTADFNSGGIGGTLGSGEATYTVDSSGRMTVTGLGGHPPVYYLVDSTQGFIVGTNNNVDFGYVEKQTLNSFNASTISGRFFFGGGGPTIGGPFDSGTVTFSPGTPSGTITGTSDESRPNFLLFCMQDCGGGGGLQPNGSFSSPYAFPTAPVAPGQFCLGDCPGDGTLGYIVSPSKIVLMQTGSSANPNPAEIIIVQQ